MAFTIPNVADAGFPAQAEPDSRDFDILTAAAATTGVSTGCAVTSTGAANGSVSVAAGTVRIGGRKATLAAAATVAITANASGNPRFDLITIDTTGAVAAVAGTAVAAPVFPTIPASRVVLAAVYVANGHTTGTTLATNTLTDKRLMISDPETENVKSYGAIGNAQGFTVTTAAAAQGVITSQLATPTGVGTSTATTSGVLAAGTYSYRISAFNQFGETLASTAVTRVTTGTTSTITISWTAVVGAIGYKVYGRNGGSENVLQVIPDPVVSWIDRGSLTGTVVVPVANTTGPFTADMVGRPVYIAAAGASSAAYSGTVSAYTSATQVTVTPNLGTAVPAAGATASIGTDDSTAITAAVAALTNGSTLYFPAGKYMCSGLVIDGKNNITITGDYATIISYTETTPVIKITNAAQIGVSKLRIQHAGGTIRTSGGFGLQLKWCQDVVVEDMYIFQTCAAGIIVDGVARCTVVANTVMKNLADGIHTTNGSADVDVVGNRLFQVGDDAISFVGYRDDGYPVTRFTCTGNAIYQGAARGISIIGASQGSVVGNSVNLTMAAGIIVAQETSYNSWGVSDVSILGNTIDDAVTYLTGNPNQSAIFISNADATFPITGIAVTGNEIRTPARQFFRTSAAATDGIRDVVFLDNMCIGPSTLGTEGVWIGSNTKGIRLANNRIAYASLQGMQLDATSAVVDGNEIYFPNQANTTSIYGIARTSGAAVMRDNVVIPDGTKTALSGHVSPAPTAAAVSGATGAGTTPPAPVIGTNANDQAGSLTFGTGSSTTGTGAYVTVTFANPYPIAPKVSIAPTTALAAAKSPYVLTVTTTTFQIGLGVAGTASQANTVYGVAWQVTP